ncbi:MAG TPA: ATP-binding protein [Candidatus Baltobacteraceae bacterium]|jgi:anti-sigma regulatory factor (Ser/Thr protein kinase)
MTAMSWSTGTVDSPNVRLMRRSFVHELRRLGRTEAEISDGEIILGELLANACEHGRLPIAVELRPSGRRWQLSVSDCGSGFVRNTLPYDPRGERGRGFHIVEQLGATIRVTDGASPNIEVSLPFGD